ncbi:hypothetical protein DL770_005808 [Monosporascus sp. CRB-9-2]|nr:hypothetical protein DL770_005808 [Monosporascus sp. CRB-9-2]
MLTTNVARDGFEVVSYKKRGNKVRDRQHQEQGIIGSARAGSSGPRRAHPQGKGAIDEAKKGGSKAKAHQSQAQRPGGCKKVNNAGRHDPGAKNGEPDRGYWGGARQPRAYRDVQGAIPSWYKEPEWDHRPAKAQGRVITDTKVTLAK